MRSLSGKKIVVMGLGRFGGGVGVTRFLVEQGAEVLVTDSAAPEVLADSMKQLTGLRFSTRFGEHRESDFTEADLIVVNPAVDRMRQPCLQAARQAGVELTSEIELLIERLPARDRVIGITGSAGKSTTTAMIGHILAAHCGQDHVHVGGNLGGSLLPELDRIASDHWVVLELSSFMLESMTDFSPHLALVTNLTANHLDRHGTIESYAAAKQNILRSQRPDDLAILPGDLEGWGGLSAGRKLIIEHADPEIVLAIPGAHNRLNATFALAATTAVDVDRSTAVDALASYAGLPHRLQLIFEHNGVRFFNDSKSTTPEAAIRAIDCFERQTTHVILGGYDKQSDLVELAHHAAEHARAVYTIGETGERIAELIRGFADSQGYWVELHRCQRLDDAVRQLAGVIARGEVALLSPGCASWDQYENFEARGRHFAELVLRYRTET